VRICGGREERTAMLQLADRRMMIATAMIVLAAAPARACTEESGRCICETADGDGSWDLTELAATEITTTGNNTGCELHALEPLPHPALPNGLTRTSTRPMRQPAHAPLPRPQVPRARATGTTTSRSAATSLCHRPSAVCLRRLAPRTASTTIPRPRVVGASTWRRTPRPNHQL
jgi:hypothetical protein